MLGCMMTKLEELISAIEEGDYAKVETSLDSGKTNGHIKSSIVNLKNGDKKTPLHIALEQLNPDSAIIKLLIENGANPNIQDSNGETLLCLLIRNRTLWSLLSQKDRNLLVDKSDINYRYSGLLDKVKQKIQADNYLHIAARAANKEAFVTICKKNITFVTAHNEDGNNPFHEAAMSGILLPVVREVMNYLEKEASKKIKKAEEAKDWKELRELKEELKCNRKYIKDALCSKNCAFNKDKRAPLYYLDDSEKKEIKEIAGIEDKLICNKNFHLCLYMVGAVVSIAALCLSLYLLFLTSQSFALSSMASMAFTGVTYLSLKACSEIYDLHNDGASVQDVGITQVSEGIAV
jgi:ankyrin repeat protein